METDKEKTGSFEEKESVAEAMGVGFSDERVSMSSGNAEASSLLDTAGTDNMGGPTESPENEGVFTNPDENIEPNPVSPVS